MKNFGDKESVGRWAYPGTAQFFWVPPIISGTEKLRISNLAGIFRGSIRTKLKIPLKILEQTARGRIQGLPIFRVPPLSQERKSYGFQILHAHL